MSDSGKPCCTQPKLFLWTLVIFLLFGFLALILTGRLDSKNPENRAYLGEFSEETTKQRWANLAEVKEAQSALVDEAKVSAALAALAKSTPKPEKTDIVVPGSPTFLKQMEQQSAPAPAPAAPTTPAPATPAPAAPAAAPAPAAPAAPPTPSQPAAPAPQAQ